jgi:hypothetical protein
LTAALDIDRGSSTRGPHRRLLKYTILNKIRADIDKLAKKKKTVPGISLIKTGYNAVFNEQ